MTEALLITNPTPTGAVVESEADGRRALATLPAEWVESVGYFCRAKLFLIRTRGPLVTNLNYWRSKGLTLKATQAIFRRLCDPEVARNHNFENQLMADLAGMVADYFRRRRVREEAERRREAEADPGGPAAFVRSLSEAFKSPQE
jgi:hypothetical protein